MLSSLFQSSTIPVLEQVVNFTEARHGVLAGNIANLDTPGYQTRDVDFQFEFMSLADGGRPRAIEVPGLVVKNDGNNVSLDREARLLAENSLRFNLASQLVKSEIRATQKAIEEGRSG